MGRLVTLFAEFLVTLGCVSCVLVDIQSGPIRGQTITLHDGFQVDSFLAVPFAKPPLQELRFAEPVDPDPWTEVFEADTLGDVCIQSVAFGATFIFTHPGWNRTSEDCLHLNLYAPTDKSHGPYPVMVWFHGGAYTSSANIQYPGHFLAWKDVIVVVANYRVGHLGFMSTGDSAAWGNWGMLDQVKALEWVQTNIAAFGGDPGRVTLFGQSAGASSSSLHMFSPRSRGLFHRIIAQSGTDFSFWAGNWPEQKPENYTRQVAQKLNCTIDDTQEMMDCLRQVDPLVLYKTSFECAPGIICQGFAPVVDHPGGFLPRTPHEARLDGDFAHQTDLISGICSDDGSLYVLGLIPESLLGGFTREEFLQLMRERFIELFADRLTGSLTEDFYQAIVFNYSPWPNINDTEDNRQAANVLATDFAFGSFMEEQVRQHVKYNNNTYSYILGWRSLNESIIPPPWMGVPHSADIPYTLGFPFMKLNQEVRDNQEFYFDVIDYGEPDLEYSNFVMTLWTNFAKTGNPTPTPVDAPFGGGPITWPAYGDKMNYINLFLDVEIKQEYRPKSHAFWFDYLPYVTKVDPIPVDQDTVEQSGSKGISSEFLSSAIQRAIGDVFQP